MKMTDKKYLVALYSFIAFGPARMDLLIKYYGNAKSAWNASPSSLRSIGLRRDLVEKFSEHKRNFDFKGYFNRLNDLKISVITKSEDLYPRNLLDLTNAPVLLYVRGNLSPKDSDAVAIVGSRKMTSYGKEVTELFSSKLASLGVTIVSGLALGIDAVAHKSALEVGGRTIAVIACGLDTIYPATNINLARAILRREAGAIISEYPLGYPALRSNFVNRNRIISGLSKAVLVVEGLRKSGTILTASHAAEQGRTVFAVPGQVTSPMSEAPYFLIGNGASIALKPEDIVSELDLQLKVDRVVVDKVLPSDDIERNILEILETEPLHIDVIVRNSKIDSNTVTAKLTMMELKGIVKKDESDVYKIR